MQFATPGPTMLTQLIQQWHHFFQRRWDSALAKKTEKRWRGYRYCGAVHDFHVPALSDADVRASEPTITAPVSRSCWRTDTESPAYSQSLGQWNKLPPTVSHIHPDFPEPYESPATDFRGKNRYFSHPVYLFLRSLVSEFPGRFSSRHL